MMRRRRTAVGFGRRGALLLALAALPIGLAAALPDAPQTPGADPGLPQKGEVFLEGTVAVTPGDPAAAEGSFVLKATRVVSADGSVAELSPARMKTVRYSAATQLSLPDPGRKPSRADLDFGAPVSVVGKDGGAGNPLTARVLRVTGSPLAGKNLLPPTEDMMGWHGYVDTSAADGDLKPDKSEPGMVRATVRKTDGVPWRAQVSQAPALTPGKTYTVRFRVRSDAPRMITVDSTSDPIMYENIGLRRLVPADETWRVYRETFTVGKASRNNFRAPVFQLGQRTGSVWFTDVAVVEGGEPLPDVTRVSPAAGAPLLFHPEDANAWGLLEVDGGRAKITAEPKVIRVDIAKPDAEAKSKSADVQVFQMTDLEPGRTYRLRFQAKSDAPRPITVIAGVDRGDYRLAGLDEKVDLNQTLRAFEYTFTAEKGDAGHTKAPCFRLGTAPGTVWITAVSLEPTGPPAPAK